MKSNAFENEAVTADFYRFILSTLKGEIAPAINEPDYEGEFDFVMDVIKSIEQQLEGVTKLETLETNKKISILAHMSFLMHLVEELSDGDEDADLDSFEEDE